MNQVFASFHMLFRRIKEFIEKILDAREVLKFGFWKGFAARNFENSTMNMLNFQEKVNSGDTI